MSPNLAKYCVLSKLLWYIRNILYNLISMENAITLAHVMGPMYVVLGLSLLLYVKPWQNVLKSWKNDHLQMLSIMFMTGLLGLITVNMYNVWEWNVWLLVTISGWAMMLKGAFYFLMPGSVIKKMLEFKSNAGILMFGAVACIAIGAALSYYSYV